MAWMGEELHVPWHTFNSRDPIFSLPTGGILLSLMVSSHDCEVGMGQMCVISRRFGRWLAETVAVEGTQRQWGGLLGEGWALMMGSYFGELA